MNLTLITFFKDLPLQVKNFLNMKAIKNQRIRGFTLIELLVVIAIIVVLSGLTTGGVGVVHLGRIYPSRN